MNNSYEFQVVENNLYWDFDIKGLKACNDFYDVDVIYYGDYATDRNENKVNRHVTMINIKQKKILYPEIKYLVGYLYLSLPFSELISIKLAREYQGNFEIAIQSTIALVNFLQQYGFPACWDDQKQFNEVI